MTMDLKFFAAWLAIDGVLGLVAVYLYLFQHFYLAAFGLCGLVAVKDLAGCMGALIAILREMWLARSIRRDQVVAILRGQS